MKRRIYIIVGRPKNSRGSWLCVGEAEKTGGIPMLWDPDLDNIPAALQISKDARPAWDFKVVRAKGAK